MAKAEWTRQSSFGVRFDWGVSGAAVVSSGCLVVVDVLSFTTSVTVAVERGTRVFPYRWRDSTAGELAVREKAELAVGRSQMSAAAPWSLSPAALRLAPFTERLVLPSPNGSTVASSAGDDVTVVAGCLRNASAVGHGLIARGWGTAEQPASVIAAGERWPDDGLRPAVEDLLGAGAVIAALHERGGGPLSPEASAALAAFRATEDVHTALAHCASGQELITSGYAEDVVIAAELDATDAVPVLSRGSGFGNDWA